MAGHTLSVGNLRAWLRIAAEARGTARGALVRALDAALRSPRSGGPASFFALDGEGSGALGASGVPFQFPFRFRFWFRFEFQFRLAV